MHCYYRYSTPIGPVVLAADGEAITGLYFGQAPTDVTDSYVCQRTDLLDRAAGQLDEYLRGRRTEFTLPQKPRGTEFQQKVWAALREIPYGQTRSYAEIAVSIGEPRASRAVGGANNRNPIPILIPCHRVIGANGKLTGYAGGLDIKSQLLKLEGADLLF